MRILMIVFSLPAADEDSRQRVEKRGAGIYTLVGPNVACNRSVIFEAEISLKQTLSVCTNCTQIYVHGISWTIIGTRFTFYIAPGLIST